MNTRVTSPYEKPSRKRTRRTKIADEAVPTIKEKFITDIPLPDKAVSFHPRGENQKRLVQYLKEGRKIVFACGVAGTGKSMIAAYVAASLLREKKITKIYLVRPNVHCGKSVGMLKGSLEEKLSPFFMQTVNHIEKFLGVGFTSYCMEKNVIEMCAVEYLRGTSFENCFVICEEAQGFTDDDFEMMLTRMGENAQVCFTGDERQVDLKDTTGLSKTLAMLDRVRTDRPDYLDTNDMNEFLTNVGIVRFTFDDVQRSPMVKALTKLYFYK